MVANIAEKGKHAGNQHFLLFAQCFQTASSTGSFKVGTVWERVKTRFYCDYATVLISFLFIVAGLLKDIQYCTDLSTGKKRKLAPSQFLVFTTPRLIIRKKRWEKKKLIVTTSSLFFTQCIFTV